MQLVDDTFCRKSQACSNRSVNQLALPADEVRRIKGARYERTKERTSRRSTFLAREEPEIKVVWLRGRVAGFEEAGDGIGESGYFVSARDLKRASQKQKSQR